MAPAENENDLLAKVKSAILSMTSPSGYGTDARMFCSIHTVNIPPMIARAEAAYERACAILKTNILAQEDSVRTAVYHDLAALFRTASENVETAIKRARKAGKTLPLPELGIYYRFLYETSALLHQSCLHQAKIASADSKLKDMLGRTLLAAAQSPDEILEDNELRLVHALSDFIAANDPLCVKMRTKFKHLLPRPEAERYQNAYSEYTACYRDFGVLPAAGKNTPDAPRTA